MVVSIKLPAPFNGGWPAAGPRDSFTRAKSCCLQMSQETGMRGARSREEDVWIPDWPGGVRILQPRPRPSQTEHLSLVFMGGSGNIHLYLHLGFTVKFCASIADFLCSAYFKHLIWFCYNSDESCQKPRVQEKWHELREVFPHLEWSSLNILLRSSSGFRTKPKTLLTFSQIRQLEGGNHCNDYNIYIYLR